MTTRLLTALMLAALAAAAYGQTPVTVTLAPIECRTRVSQNAVRLGEPVTLVLTCTVIETESTAIVLDESRLDPAVLQVPPFDVVGGTRAADVRTPTHRVIQYEYSLRFIGEQIGADVTLQGLTLNYRVQNRVNGSAVEGRERQYLLPSHRIRIISQVPTMATGIHDPLPDSLSALAQRRFRARAVSVTGWSLIALGGVLVVWALVAVAAPRRGRTSTGPGSVLVPDRAVLRAAARVLARVEQTRQREGWSDRLAAEALAPLRIAAAYSIGRPVTQAPATADTEPAAGQVRVVSYWPRRRLALASAAAGTIAQVPGIVSQPAAPADATLYAAIESLSAAAYGRTGVMDSSDLDQALEAGAAAIRRVSRRFAWWARAVRSATQTAAQVRGAVWGR